MDTPIQDEMGQVVVESAVSRAAKPAKRWSDREVNPILARELRSRTRRPGGIITLTLFLLLLIGIAAIVWSVNRSVGSSFDIEEAANARVGLQIFEGVMTTMMFLIAFIVPALTAPAIAGERDRQTLIPLQVSLLTPRQIILGKMSAALAFMVLLIVASTPMLAVSYVIGGITAMSVLRGLVAVLIVAMLFGAIGILCSALPKRTAAAVVLAYGLTIVIVILGPGVAALIGWVTIPKVGFVFGYSHPYAFVSDFTYPKSLSNTAGPMSGLNETMSHSGFPYWTLHILFYGMVCFGCLWLAAKRIRTPAETER